MKEYKYQTLQDEETTIYSNEEQDSSNQPFTVEDLKHWIKCQDVSDISNFGFHIGFDSQKTGEAGLYIEDGEYIFYQNGYDGQKYILYRGPNETFAVRQFMNLFNKKFDSYNRINRAYKEKNNQRKENKRKTVWLAVILVVIGCVLFISTRADEGMHYRNSETGDLYHLLRYEDSNNKTHYNWCIYDPESKEWNIIEGANSRYFYPSGINCLDSYYICSSDYECYEEVEFYRSRLYYRYNYYQPFESGYYSVNSDLYYFFIVDYYWYEKYDGIEFGFYKYDKENNGWDYYCTYYESENKNEELYFYHELHQTGYDYYVNKELKSDEIVPIRFEETEFYKEYLERGGVNKQK